MSGNDKKVIGKSAYRTYRKNLLGGTAIVAVVAVGIAFGVGQYSKAQAANLALDGNATTVITPTLADTIVDLAGSDVATIDVDVNAGDIVVGSNTVQSVNFDTNSGSIFLFDSNADAEATVNFDGDITIVAGKTLTFQLGDDEDSGTGLISVNLNIRDDNNANIFIAGPDAATRGGNLVIDTVAILTNITGSAVNINAEMLLDTVTTKGGNATATGVTVGNAMTIALGDAVSDAINLTGLVATGGNGVAANVGGANQTRVTGTLAVGTTGINIDGGTGGTTSDGGIARVLVDQIVTTLTGAVTIDGGLGGSANGSGGAAELEFTLAASAASNFTITGGIGGTGGTGNGGIATLDADAAFTTTGTVTFAGGNAGLSTAATADGGAAIGEFASTINVLGLTLTGGDGAIAGDEAGVGGAATAVVAGVATVGTSGIAITAGNGGTFAGGAIGGASTLTLSAASVITGNIGVTGGNGSDNNAADGGVATLNADGAVTATQQTLTITGGDGSSAADAGDGDGGNAVFALTGATAVFNSIVLDDGTDGNATGGTATLTLDLAGAQSLTGAITAATGGEGTLNITNAATGVATIVSAVGVSGTNIGTISIASGITSGSAKFNSAVFADTVNIGLAANLTDDAVNLGVFDSTLAVTTLNIIGGTANAAEASTGTFTGNVTVGGIFTMTGGTANAGSDVTANFNANTAGENSLTVTGVTNIDAGVFNGDTDAIVTVTGNATFTGKVTLLGGANAGADATLNLNGTTVVFTTGLVMDDSDGGDGVLTFTPITAQGITGKIDAFDATDEGEVNVLGGTNLVTFNTAIGSDFNILSLNVGATGAAANAKFVGSVDAAAITITTELNSSVVAADFDGTVTATTIAVTAGDAADETASASFAANVSGAMTLSVGTGSQATVTFDGAVDQSITGDIQGAGNNQGIVVISNTAGTVTFNDDIGDASNARSLDSIQIVSGATLKQLAPSATGKTLEFDVEGNIDANGALGTGGTLTIEAGAGLINVAATASTIANVDINGAIALTTLNITGGAGADGSTETSTGGAVSAVTVAGAVTSAVNITGGKGGAGLANDASTAGAGGAISSVDFATLVTGAVALTGGDGGAGAAGGGDNDGGTGGAGGAAQLDFTGGLTGALTIASGSGGNAGALATNRGGLGGDGGAVVLVDIVDTGTTAAIGITAGGGGIAGEGDAGSVGNNGGAGGNVTLDLLADDFASLTVVGGTGGTGGVGTNGSNDGGVGGNAGTVAFTTVTGSTTGNVSLTAGAGGTGGADGAGASDGGAGGTGSSITLAMNGVTIGGTLALDNGTVGAAGADGSGAGDPGAGGAGGTVTVIFDGAAAQAVTGAVTAGSDNEGTITLRNVVGTGVTFASNIGASGAGLDALNVGDDTGASFGVFAGDVFATDISVNGQQANTTADFNGNVTGAVAITVVTADTTATATFFKNVTGAIVFTDNTADQTDTTATFDGTSAQTISGALTGSTDGVGVVITNNAAGVTFSSTLGIEDTNLESVFVTGSTSAKFAGAVNANTITLNGTSTFGENANEANTLLIIPAGATIIVSEAVRDTETLLEATAITMLGGANTVGLQMPSNFTSGTITLIDDDTGSTDISADVTDFLVVDTALVNYTVITGVGDNTKIDVTASKNSIASIASTLGVSNSAASSLDLGVSAATNDATVSAAYTTALNAGGAEAKKAAEQSEPVQISAASAAIGGGATAVSNIVSGRLASVRGESNTAYASARGHSGFAAGDGAMSKSAWFRPFISSSDQDNSNDADGGAIDGYQGSTFGLAGGFDGMIGEQARLGLSFAYADTEIDGDGIQNDKTEIENYQLTLYGDYTTDNIYLEGMLSYGLSNVDTSREITFGGLDLLARGSYDADQYTVRVGGGMPLTSGSTTFTPHAAFQYTNVSSDSFTETGAGVLNLVIAPEDLDMAVGIFGLNWQSSFQSTGGTWTPQIRTSVSYDFAADDADSVSRFTGQTTVFTTKGAEVEELGGAIGAGMTFSTADGSWAVSADYDADVKNDFLAHTGRLQAKFNF